MICFYTYQILEARGDCLPSILRLPRYNEWGRQILEFQKERLRTGKGREYYFTSYHTGDEKVCAAMKSEIAGTLMTATGLKVNLERRLKALCILIPLPVTF